MKNLRKELIDFLKWYREEWTIPEYKLDENTIEDYFFERAFERNEKREKREKHGTYTANKH